MDRLIFLPQIGSKLHSLIPLHDIEKSNYHNQ